MALRETAFLTFLLWAEFFFIKVVGSVNREGFQAKRRKSGEPRRYMHILDDWRRQARLLGLTGLFGSLSILLPKVSNVLCGTIPPPQKKTHGELKRADAQRYEYCHAVSDTLLTSLRD